MTTEEQVLLLAGPGSGKTATIVGRIHKLIEDGVDPARHNIHERGRAGPRGKD